jgi:hypothetical protein
MSDAHKSNNKEPKPGSAANLFQRRKPMNDPAKDIEEKGEPSGGSNFA